MRNHDLGTNNAAMHITPDLNVGIGTDEPLATLDVVKDTGPDPQVSIRSGVAAKDGILAFPLSGASKASIITNKDLTFHTLATDNSSMKEFVLHKRATLASEMTRL